MLVVSRKRDERVVIDGNIVVTVLSIGPENVKLGIDAPDDVPILREELVEQDDEVR